VSTRRLRRCGSIVQSIAQVSFNRIGDSQFEFWSRTARGPGPSRNTDLWHSARAAARILRQLAVVVNQFIDRGAQKLRVEDSPATSSPFVSVDDRANLSFFSSSRRFSVYEIGALVASCSALSRRFCVLRQTLQLFARQTCRRMKLISISSPVARQQPPLLDTPLNWI
jgi:hypothetical protein